MYQSHFCGLGTGLHRRYGLWARGLVNRDSTFLLLLGSALGDDAAPCHEAACCNPLGRPRRMVAAGPLVDYVAAVTVCGLTTKLDDDAQDERGWRRWLAQSAGCVAGPAIDRALAVLHAQRFPVSEVRLGLGSQSAVEQKAAGPTSATLVACAAPTAAAYGQIAAHLGRLQGQATAAPDLQHLGSRLGFLVYAHDAWTDYDRDQRRHQFNPLTAWPDPAARRAALAPLLRNALDSLRETLDELPLQRHRDLLRSVLVDGARQRVEQVSAPEGKADSEDRHRRSRRRREQGGNRWCDGCDCCQCCDCGDCGDCGNCARCSRVPRVGKGGNSACDCNPCDGDGCECCGCDCGCPS